MLPASPKLFGKLHLRHLQEILEIKAGREIEENAQVHAVKLGVHREAAVNLADFGSEPDPLENRLLVFK